MYELNLIHEKIVPISKQRTRLSLAALYALIWAVTATVFSYYYITFRNEILTYQSAVRLIETRNALPKGLTREDVLLLARQLDTTRETLLALKNQVFLWGPKLERIKTHLPRDAWLDEISCRLSTSHFKKNPSNPSGPPEPLGEFVIQGRVLLAQNAVGSESLEQYVVKLREDKEFMARVQNMNHLVLGRERYGSNEVARFIIVCVVEEGVRFDG
jgi:hypothetical protein